MTPILTEPIGPDGEKAVEPDLIVENTSAIVHLPQWTESAIICWGGLRLGGQVTVHLVCDLVIYGATMGGLAACMPKWGPNVIWTFEFGFKSWDGAALCKNCFETYSNGLYAPKKKRMPPQGWLTFAAIPKIELKKSKKAAVIQAILAVSPQQAARIDRTLEGRPADSRRIVEV